MPASTYLGNAILNHFLRGVPAAVPPRLFVSLHTADPGNAGDSEVTTVAWPAYVRLDAAQAGAVAGGFQAAANKATENLLELLYPANDGAAPITVTHFGIWDDDTGGNFIWRGTLTAPKTLNPTDECILHSGDLDLWVD